MLIQITNISAGNISIPFGPTLAPQESCFFAGSDSIEIMTWSIMIMGIDINAVGGLTKENRLQYDIEKTIIDMSYARLISVSQIE